MSFYNNMTSDAADMMYQGKYDKNAKNGEAAWKMYNVSVNAQPKSCIKMAHTWTQQQEWTGDKYAQAIKNATKIGMKHCDTNFDLAAANDKWSFKAGHPLVADDFKVNGSLSVEQKPAKNETKATVATTITTPDMSGVKAFMNLSVESTWKDINTEKDSSKKAVMVAGFSDPVMNMDANINFEKDYYLGVAVEHDSKKMTESAVSFVKKDEGDKFWVNYDSTRSIASTGCFIHYADRNFTHAYEAKYNHSNTAALKLFAQPLSVAMGGKYVLSKETTLTYGIEFGKAAQAQAKYDHKINKNLKVTIKQSYDSNRLADGKRTPYDLGFDASYTV